MRAVPGRTEPYLARGLALESLGEAQAAARVFCETLEIRPECAEVHESLVSLLRREEKLLDLPEIRRLAETLEARANSGPGKSVVEGTLAVLRGDR